MSCRKDSVSYIDQSFKKDALNIISSTLPSYRMKIIVHDIKKVKETFSKIKKILNSVDDLKIMSYSLDTGKHDHSISNIVAHNLSEDVESFSASTLIEIHEELEQRLSKEKRLKDIYTMFDKPLMKVIFDTEKNGMSLDVQKLQDLRSTLSRETGTLASEIFKLAGRDFKINLPKELKSVLFKEMKLLDKVELGKKLKLRFYGDNTKVLEELKREGVEIASKVLRWRSLNRRNSNIGKYISKVDSDELRLFDRICANFLATTAKTCRLTSSNPD